MPRSSALRAYRRRVKTSACRGLQRRTCKGKMGCKYVSGSKRKFCRKSGNTKRHSMSLRKMRGGSVGVVFAINYTKIHAKLVKIFYKKESSIFL